MRSICQNCLDKGKCGFLRNGHESKCLDVQTYDWGYEDAVSKACEWLSTELNQLAMDKLDEDFLRNNFKVILKAQVPEWIERFRKTMEG